MKTSAMIASAVLLAAAAWGFLAVRAADVELDTRIYELQYLETATAEELISPYVFWDRPESPGRASSVRNLITVTETADNLEKIERVLRQYDTAPANVQLKFQIIEANGTRTTDDAIADIESVLRQLFRFEGYRLAADAMMGGIEGSHINQVLGDESAYRIDALIASVRTVGDSGIVNIQVGLTTSWGTSVFETSANVRIGQTMVLGSTQPTPGGKTIILTVRPEIVEF